MPLLTDRYLKSLTVEPGQKDRLVFDTEAKSLGVRVTAAGTKTFIIQWTDRATKRKVRERIDTWGNVTIQQARDAAKVRLSKVAMGIDVVAERRLRKAADEAARAEAALSLGSLIDEWAELHLSKRRPKYRAEATRALRYAFSDSLTKPASKLTKQMVLSVLERLEAAGKVAMAASTIAYGRAAYTWARKRGKVPANPFMDLPIAPSTTARDRCLSDAEIAEVWAAAGLMPYPFRQFFQLAVLTMQRREEVAAMGWGELSADLTLWTIPSKRMKNGKPHDVHLAEPAREILSSIPRMAGCDFVFSTNGRSSISGFSRAKIQLDAKIAEARTEAGIKKPMPAWRVHDLRRTGVSLLAGLGFDSIPLDKLLAHAPAKLAGVAAVYQRHSYSAERTRALDTWAAHVIGQGRPDNVVTLKARVPAA